MTTTAEPAAAGTEAAAAHGAEGHKVIDPIHQFNIEPIVPINIGGIDASLTNSGLWAIIAVATVSLVMLLAPRRLVPTRFQSVAESAYELVFGMIDDVLGPHGRQYFPFVFTLFAFILASNLLGLIPHSFTVTSHIIVTLGLALTVFIGATAIGFIRNGAGYLKLFVPSGVPWYLMLILVPIEVISYFIRPFSLSIRLFANMVAGHMMLKVTAGFVVLLGLAVGWLPLLALVALYALELLVACLQAYVFALLTCIYLNDALHVHH